MGASCSYTPKRGIETFYKLKKELGYEKAWNVYGIVISSRFLLDYGDTLSYDAEGVPTFSSIMQNPFIQNYIGEGNALRVLLEQYTKKEDTLDNYDSLLEEAYKFNTSNPNKNKFTAVIDYEDDGIIVRIVPKSKAADEEFWGQYKSLQLNKRLIDMFAPIGVTPGQLTEAEMSAGRVGVTDFSKARRMATDLINMIRIANNREGAEALSEEFSHLIIGALRDRPLVTRALNVLKNDPDALKEILGDEYEDTVQFHEGDMEMVAEEALGQLLQKNLKIQNETKSTTLLNRLMNFIKSLFKKINIDEVLKAISEADNAINVLAKDVLSGKTEIRKEDIEASKRDVLFNALSDRIQRNIDILTKAKDTELKKYRISDSEKSKEAYKERVKNLKQFLEEDADTVEGILHYARLVLTDLRDAHFYLRGIELQTTPDMFKRLRGIRSTLLSYRTFVDALNVALSDELDEEDNMFLKKFIVESEGGVSEEVDVTEIIKEVNLLMGLIDRRLMRVAKDKFTNFLTPFLGEGITIGTGKHKGEKISVKELLDKADKDISFFDRWLDSMSDSSDVILQAFDAIVKKANDTARLNTIANIREIQALRKKAESYGITDFEWMFEKFRNGKKTGNYIDKLNYSQFHQDYNEMMDRLNKKYGRNAKGEAAREKLEERQKWIDKYANTSIFGDLIPKDEFYGNKDYKNLTERLLEILNEFLALKERLDSKYPSDKVDKLKAVQIRKNGVLRFIDATSSPSQILSNIKEHITSELFEKEDDDTIFGDTSIKKGLTDFSGKEFMIMPVLYNTRLSNPEELSTDVFGSLMAYSAMSHKYEQMEKVIDPLEVGRSIITDGGRQVRKTRGGNKIVELVNALGEKVASELFESSGTNIEKKLDDFFESQVYGKYLKDLGTFEVFGNKVNVNKLTSKWLKLSSVVQLGFNYLANIANVTTGVAMQNIEAAAGEFFSARELAKADAVYVAAMKDFMAELGSRDKKSKLALVDELFDIKGDFNKKMRFSDQRRSLLKRIFGSSIAFLGLECGDHWLYNRTAIAMMLREKVTVPGKGEMNLWDALQVTEENGLGKLILPEGTLDSKGKPFDIGKFSRKMLHVNQSLFGIYNDEDANAANRIAVGRLMMLYRKWMKAQYNKRFMAGLHSLALDQWEEGYYRTTLRFMNELARGKFQLATLWDQLSDHEKANIKRALAEIIQCLAVWCMANFIEWPDDKNRPWAMKLAEYSCKRSVHELGNLTPSLIMADELLKTVKTPAASLSLIGDITNLVGSTIDPRDWTNEILTGPYKGMSTYEKHLLKAPIPGVSQYRLINRFVNEIDTSIDYYARSY